MNKNNVDGNILNMKNVPDGNIGIGGNAIDDLNRINAIDNLNRIIELNRLTKSGAVEKSGKSEYVSPEIEPIEFDNTDIITASGDPCSCIEDINWHDKRDGNKHHPHNPHNPQDPHDHWDNHGGNGNGNGHNHWNS